MEINSINEVIVNNDLINKKERSIKRFATFFIILLCVLLCPTAIIGGAMSGSASVSYIFFIGFLAPLIILIFRKRPEISLIFSLILFLIFYKIDIEGVSQGRAGDFSGLTGLVTLIASLQIVLILIKERKIDDFLIKTYPFVIVLLLIIFSTLVVKSEDFVSTLLN